MSGDFVKIEGVIEKILFFSDESHYCVARLKPSEGGSVVVISGTLPEVQCGETLLVEGIWQNHKAYGAQIKVNSFKSKLPSSLYGIKKFLGSGLVEGIGEVYANKIVNHFGLDTLKIIDEDSARLKEIPGVGPKRIKQIRESWQRQRCLREVVVLLRTYGVGMKNCAQIVAKYDSQSSEIIKTKPYLLAREIAGIGFKTADQIALNAGMSNESPARIEAGILYTLQTLQDEGHTLSDKNSLAELSSTNLSVPFEKCFDTIASLIEKKDLTEFENNVQLPQNAHFEKQIAHHLNVINESLSELPAIDAERALQWARDKAKIDFAKEQNSAILSALQNKVSIITGGPGTGKTTILRALCDILKAKKVSLSLAAPTGRAAQRMSESCAMPAKTIHRLLGLDPETSRFLHNDKKTLTAQFVIIDEASMLDSRLACAIFSAISETAHLLIVGDVDQLPSVGAGNVLADIINSKKFATTRLSQIFRQGKGSSIVSLSHKVLAGEKRFSEIHPCKMTELNSNDDVSFVELIDPQECMDAALELIKKFIPQKLNADFLRDVQMLVPMHRGSAGIEAFNKFLQKSLNHNKEFISCGSNIFKENDKVIQTRNNYDLDVFNGDMGIIKRIDFIADKLWVDFDGKDVEYCRSDLIDLHLAYAISVHKSQGSEFPILILPLLKQYFMLLQRNLLYTALTRAKKKIFIIGDSSALQLAISNDKAIKRKTGLMERF